MPNLTLSIPEELHKRMRKHTDIRWSEVVRKSISERVDKLELMDKLLKNSELTEDDVKKLAHKIDTKVAKRFDSLKK